MKILPPSDSRTQKRKATTLRLMDFVSPSRNIRHSYDFERARISAVIPTFKPGNLTAALIVNLIEWHRNIHVYVVDDCTPLTDEGYVAIFKRMGSISNRVSVLRTPQNSLKAGALNFALSHIYKEQKHQPDVILSLDDDIVITPDTIPNLVTELMSTDSFGAVCSQCRVLNKNKNILTRLQGLEYLGFNATRLADEGFYLGPLVMHGMLTAFRTEALREVGGFCEGHLIEDYEITARLKAKGWCVKAALNAPAWTIVPETFPKLWRQRTRWSYGGITVITKTKHRLAVLQDLIGHGIFLTTLLVICLLVVLSGSGRISPLVAYWIITLSFLQLALWYVFQLWLMRLYKDKDIYDWFVRICLLPEFVYGNLMTIVVVGSYLFFMYNFISRIVLKHGGKVAEKIIEVGKRLFRMFGYTEGWGTRTH